MEDQKKHSLGRRAFLLFLSRRLRLTVIMSVLGGTLLYAEQWLSSPYSTWDDYAAKITLLVAAAFFLFALAQAFLEYRYYTYTFTHEAFIMTYGYLVRNEVAALYHQIQYVNILRSPLDRMAGVSQVVIIMTGTDRSSERNKIVLPAVGKKKAKMVQQELLHRARRHFGREVAEE